MKKNRITHIIVDHLNMDRTLDSLIAELQKVRDEAKLVGFDTILTSREWNGDYSCIQIHGERWETDAELKVRSDAEKARRADIKRMQDVRDLQEFERLQKKFGKVEQ
jgi:hypothetical protein